tara:strand:+ start:1224 stop:1946 length:723 start_codon:yes stop_codon:yes gene_type:complete
MIRFVLALCLSCAVAIASSNTVAQGQQRNLPSKDVADKRAKGLQYFEKGDIQRGYPLLRPLAESGDLAAQSWVGLVLARSYIQRVLAKSGIPLGVYAEKNFSGIPHDPVKGLALIHQSANANHPQSMYFLAVLYAGGEGVDKNEKLSRKYVRQAANLGYLTAQLQMAHRLMRTDPAKSYKWYFIFSHCSKLGPRGDNRAFWDSLRRIWLENNIDRELFVPEGKKLIAAWEEKHGKLCLGR